jgi:carboxyl-terminal processing protease
MKQLTYKLVAYFALTFLFISGCKKNDTISENGSSGTRTNTTTTSEAPILTQKVNNFIKAAMTDVYLWYNYLPTIDTRYETDSKAYFEKLLYKDDKWS